MSSNQPWGSNQSIWVRRGWNWLLEPVSGLSLDSSLCDQNLHFLPKHTPCLAQTPLGAFQGSWELGLQTPALGILMGLMSVPHPEISWFLFQTDSQAWAPQMRDRDGEVGFQLPAPKRKNMFHWAPSVFLNLFFWWALLLFNTLWLFHSSLPKQRNLLFIYKCFVKVFCKMRSDAQYRGLLVVILPEPVLKDLTEAFNL